jgi:hypothetical protein
MLWTRQHARGRVAPPWHPHLDITVFKRRLAERPPLADGRSIMRAGSGEEEQSALVRAGHVAVRYEQV